MNQTAPRSAPAAAEGCARGEARWSTLDVFADRALSLIACAMLALVLSTSLLLAAPRARPIVNGHTVQPRPGDLRTPDLSGRDAEDVERLYRELMGMTAAGEARGRDAAAGRQGIAKTP